MITVSFYANSRNRKSYMSGNFKLSRAWLINRLVRLIKLLVEDSLSITVLTKSIAIFFAKKL